MNKIGWIASSESILAAAISSPNSGWAGYGTYNDSHWKQEKYGNNGWEGKFITSGEKDLYFGSASGFETEESLDGATIVLEGYAELFNGKYKVAYLPADASPTGSKFSPTILSVTQPGEKQIKAIKADERTVLFKSL